MTTDMNLTPKSVHPDELAVTGRAQLHGQKAIRLRLGGIGLTKLYELWGSGELGSCYIGSRRYSSEAQIEDFIQRLESKQESAS